jgi:hypothetical protein
MSYSRGEVEQRATRYAANTGALLERELGFGVHGIVWSTDRKTAVKVHAPQSIYYYRERDIYLRLRDYGVTKVLDFRVPRLLGYDDDLWAIEIAIVHPPFVIDFAGASLDRRPDYSEEVWADWRHDKADQFGHNWPRAQAVVAALEYYGIFMSDVSPNNVRFAEDRPDA